MVQIAVRQVKLRSLPAEPALVLHVVEEDGKFQFVFPTHDFAADFNVVDATTQQDHWLPGKTFKIVEATETPRKQRKR